MVWLWLTLWGCEPVQTYDYSPTCESVDEVVLEQTPTWSDGVGEIVAERCAGCHQSGGVAPFSLTSEEAASTWSTAIGVAVEAGTMPPWPPTDCGECGDWRDSRALSAEQTATLLAWVDAGAPAGDTGLATVEPATPPALPRVDATLTMAEAYTPDAAGADDYRCFLVDPDLGADGYLTGFDLHPGDDRVVHHAILYLPADGDAVAAAEELDAGEEGYGWTCFGGPGVNASFGAGWVPGVGAVAYPEGTGIELVDQPVVLQIHYNLANGAFPDQTELELMVEDSVQSVAFFNSLSQQTLALEPGQAEVTRGTTSSPLGEAKLWGLVPHMHELGSSIQVQLHHDDGESECLIDIPEWDFHWQGMYFYESPVQLEEGDVVELGCVYDTRGVDEVVDWGEGTADEMCLFYAYITID